MTRNPPATFRATRRALLLQGPVGPFFRRLADELIEGGAEVTKVNFNGGDSLYFRGPEVVTFRQPMNEWPAFARRLFDERNFDAVFLFGDCRVMHRQAIDIARERGASVWVFEEGYLRPNLITMEPWGVNGHSQMPKDPEFYRTAGKALPEPPEPRPVGHTFAFHAVHTGLHSVAATASWWRFPHYRHHRNINAFEQMYCWVRGAVRKVRYSVSERGILDHLTGPLSGDYFFVPLQVYCDAQWHHAPYDTVEEFVGDVIHTFAEHAPAGTHLVFKHHPHDRPYRDYTRLLGDIAAAAGCADRVIYVHDLHLPTMLKHARGCVTMNSTVGTSSMFHATPVKVLGNAVYNMPGLTYQGTLAQFFRDPGSVDMELFHAFCRWLKWNNQFGGSFYKKVLPTTSGVDLKRPVPLGADPPDNAADSDTDEDDAFTPPPRLRRA